MDICSALLWAQKKLLKSTSPILDSEVLLSSVLNKPREYILAYPEKRLTAAQEKKFRQLVARRSRGEPIAYLTGHKEFYGLDFIVNRSVLIPRPETELLIDGIIATCHPFVKLRAGSERSEGSLVDKKDSSPPHRRIRMTIVDVGTGSGCIAITLAKLFPRTKIFALDISKKALQVARQNAHQHKVAKQIKFLQGSLLAPLKKQLNNKTIEQVTIVANLPYLTKKQMAEPSIKHEPRAALYGGKDGLEYYEELFKQITASFNLQASGFKLLCEIDPKQTSKIKKLIKKYLPTAKINIKKDLAGLERIVCITRSM